MCAAERTRQRLEAARGLAKLTNRLEELTGVDVDGDGDVNEKCLERGFLSLASNVQSGQDSLGEASGRAQPKHGGAVGEARAARAAVLAYAVRGLSAGLASSPRR